MLSKTRETGRHAKPYLRNRDVQWGHISVQDLPMMDFSPDDVDRFRLELGDVLVCEGGEVGRAAVWAGELGECYFQKALHRVRPSSAVSPSYLRYLFEHYATAKQFGAYTSGSTIAHLPQEDLRNLLIPLPPSPEQERIVAAIEEEFSRLDAGMAAVASAERRLEVALAAIVVHAIPEPLPPGWRIESVAKAGQVRLGRQRAPQYHSGPNMRPYLRVANVFEDRIDKADVMQMHFDAEEFDRYRLHPGDILLNEGQSPHLIGRPAMYRGDPPDVAFTNSLLRFRPRDGILSEWALLVFRRHLHARRFMRESQITTNIAHLSAGRFKNVEFPVPPLEVQEEIISAVNDQLRTVNSTATAVLAARLRAGRLRNAILQAAFSGQLVPADPNEQAA